LQEVNNYFFLFPAIYDKISPKQHLAANSPFWMVIPMKRIIALLLCTAIVFALAACGSDETPATTAPAVLVTEPPAETAAPTDAPAETVPAPTETRTLLENAVLFDTFTVSSQKAHVYDWFFHVQGKLLDGEQGTLTTLEKYPLLSSVRSLGNGKGRVLRFETALGVLAVEIRSDAELFLAKSPSNPSDILRETVLLRIHAPSAEFAVSYRLQ
jgi:hypothetical protein